MLTQLGARSPASLPPPDPDTRRRTAAPTAEHVLIAVGCGLAFGVLLGCWCRAFASSSSVNGVLANLAAPWVAAAFVSGAIVARPPGAPDRRAERPVPAAIVGAIAGTVCLVVATVMYYGPARTGTFDFSGAVVRTTFWAVAGIVFGAMFGAAGAVWRTASSPRLRACSVVSFGAIVVGEAAFLVFVGATKYDAFALPVLLAVAVIGLAIPLLLGPAREAPRAAVWVVVLAVPVVVGGMAFLAVAISAARVLRDVT